MSQVLSLSTAAPSEIPLWRSFATSKRSITLPDFGRHDGFALRLDFAPGINRHNYGSRFASLVGAARESALCSAVAIPTMASMHDWKPTASTGRRRRAIGPVDGSTILADEGKLCIVKSEAERIFRPVYQGIASDDATAESRHFR
jgi:hypothetical protein